MSTTQAQEELLAAAHRVLAGRIDDRPQGPHDDSEAEYAEDQLAIAARKLIGAKLCERLAEAGEGKVRSALEERILQVAAQTADDATAEAGGDHRFRVIADEAAVMELALVELADHLDGENLDREEGREIAIDALPEGAGKAA